MAITHKAVAVADVGEPVANKLGALEWNAKHRNPYGLILAASEFDQAAFAWNIPAGDDHSYGVTADPEDTSSPGVFYRFLRITEIRFVVNVAAAGPSGSYLYAAASYIDPSTGNLVMNGLGVAARDPFVAVHLTGLKDTGWMALRMDLRTLDESTDPLNFMTRLPLVHIRGGGGDGITIPQFGSIFLYGR